MDHFDKPQRLLCLTCATLVDPSEIVEAGCPACGEPIDVQEVLKLYEFAAETYYYGHQYRVVYEKQFKESENRVHYSLAFAGEAFAWVMLAVLSGVVGNAAYDHLKAVVARIRADVAAGKVPEKDYSPLLELSDEELGSILYSAKQYLGGMEGLTQEVRLAIAEEIAADAVSHDPKIAEELMSLMSKKTVKPKDRQRFAKLMRHAVVRQKRRTSPDPNSLKDLWGKVGEK